MYTKSTKEAGGYQSSTDKIMGDFETLVESDFFSLAQAQKGKNGRGVCSHQTSQKGLPSHIL